MSTIVVITSLVFAWIAVLPLLIAIARGEFEPPYSTYIGWSLVSVTQIFLHWQTIGEDFTSFAFVTGFGLVPCITLLLMVICQTPWYFIRRDIVVYIGLSVSWLAWILTNGTNGLHLEIVPLVFLALADGFSSWPIFVDGLHGKLYKFRFLFTLTALSSFLGLLTVEEYTSLELFIPLYLAIYMTSIALASWSSNKRS